MERDRTGRKGEVAPARCLRRGHSADMPVGGIADVGHVRPHRRRRPPELLETIGELTIASS
ncbi:MAG TPA: hypothetical protein VHZ33_02650 [Trebonia sp.]|nr:hypothetical protein [Trebonia sp.]